MFTGIIQHLGRVSSIKPADFGVSLIIDAGGWKHRPELGDSIAVNGCCLSVAELLSDSKLRFDVIRQTLSVTTLGILKPGSKVNLEHAVTPQTLLGGHIVQGHVDGTGVIAGVERSAAEHRLRISVGRQLMDAIVEKGSIAVDGVSLTIAKSEADWFEVALIPTTLHLTNLGDLGEGDRVNLETDYLAKVVINVMRRNNQPRHEA